MAFVVRLSNLVKKRSEEHHLTVPSLKNQEWLDFVAGELEASNKNNNKSLGGYNK